MPVPSSVQNGLSTAANVASTPVNAPTYTMADTNPTSLNPSQVIPRAGEQFVQARVPRDTPPYYTLIKVSHYSRASWRSVGNLELESGVVFPFPSTMVDNQNIRYAHQPLSFLAGVGWDAIGGLLSNKEKLAMIKQELQSIQGATRAVGEAAQSIGGAIIDVVGGVASGAAPGIAAPVLGAIGLAVNDFMTIMLEGPSYARRDFVWRFSPRSPEESEELRKAILILKTAAAPSLAGFTGSAFFGWPRIFNVEFRYIDPAIDMGRNTFRMKPMVLNDVSTNWTPMGTWAAYGKTKMPESVDVRLAFTELEYWLNSTRRSRDAFEPSATGYSGLGDGR